jgi:hypothetical protein
MGNFHKAKTSVCVCVCVCVWRVVSKNLDGIEKPKFKDILSRANGIEYPLLYLSSIP